MKLAVIVLAAALLAGACGSDGNDDGGVDDDADSTAVSGTVNVPDSAPALPDDAVLTVRVEDVSLADAPSVVIAEDEFAVVDGDFPVDFELSYDVDEIESNHTYSVSVRVTSGDDLLMITDTSYPVITNDAPTTGIDVTLIAV